MVKAKKRSFRRDSDNDEDSDSDYVPDPDEAKPMKYSLRKRTKQNLVDDDFDYNVDSDLSSPRRLTDDDDFDVGNNPNELEPYVQHRPPTVSEQGTSQDQQLDNGLIDFEDMIRADIVINRNRIDYDNVIGSNEIKIDNKRRGRPPKRKQIEEFSHSILGPFVDALVPPFEPDIPANTVHNPKVTCTQLNNGLESRKVDNPQLKNTVCASQVNKSSHRAESLTKTTSKEEVRPVGNEKNHGVNGLSSRNDQPNNGSGKGNIEALDFGTQSQKSDNEELKPSTQPLLSVVEYNDTDDVIIIEEKPDVIVLDD